ncbi:Vacuolar protein sorting-associated protein 55 [Pichia californica]|uniref:Vacuolar protein sorting-associated protein 55 n=1 Tax=Pichia californica TaxID=460514 RepID=A0A9P6WG39_9ASCO|nr:Vacuolar protein sorting-associated protein 55 [[Candida] californica]KAG0686550.1 Vacuolar protein sorting-associated protein 55 [[Candida] californica]
MAKTSPLTTLFSLSLLLALGFFNIVLSCALYETYYPLFVILVFLLAPIPNTIAGCVTNSSSTYYSGYGDMDDSDPVSNFEAFMKFLTGMLVSSGTFLPIVLWHNNIIPRGSFLLSLSGGFLVYLSFVLFGMGFQSSDEDNYDF